MSNEEYIQEYYANNAKKLRVIVDSILRGFGGISDNAHFYSLANEVFVRDILRSYDGKSNFNTYVYTVLRRKILTEITRLNRDKRMPYVKNGGNKVKDENGNDIRIPILSLETTTVNNDDGEEVPIKEMIKSNYNLENDVLGGEDNSDKVEKYLSRLSKKQRKIVEMLMESYSPDEIREELHIDKKEYNDCMENIRAYENVSIFFGR